MTPRPARILHTSDCHLEYCDGGPHQRAFEAAIDLSIAMDVDLVLIAGDLFDHSRVGDEMLEWTATQLDRAQRPVVLLAGNHDSLHESSIYYRFQPSSRCEQVRLLDDAFGSTVSVPGTDVVVWGRAMVEHDPAYRPLHGSPPRTPGTWHVVAAHGLVVNGSANGRSSPIPRDDITALDADYVALGHIHVHQVVSREPLATYSGATASSRNGQAGCVLVDLQPDSGVSARWMPLAI